MRRALCVFLTTVLSITHGISATPANLPLEDFVTSDGLVYALTETNGVLYFGGSFTSAARRTGSGVPVSASTGQPEAEYPMVNGTVSKAIPDGSGGWFVGGNFTRVGGLPRTNLVHIRADRSVDPTWRPTALGGSVGSLILNGNTLYAGGFFTNVNGQARNRLAAIHASSGDLLGWNPDANAVVNAMVIDAGVIYVSGEFTTISVQPRSYIAAIDAVTGSVTSWNPGADGIVEALAISNGRLFAGGRFAIIGTQSRLRLASFDLATGSVDGWNPGVGTVTIVSPVVFEIAVKDDTVFVAGQFGTVGTSNRVNIAAVDATTGVTKSWDARADLGLSGTLPTASIQAMAIHGSAVLVGGVLMNIGGQPRLAAAALDAATGDATSWNPNPNANPITFSASGDVIYMGGLFSGLGGLPRTNAAAFDLTTRQVTSWNPNASGGAVWSLLPYGDRMYMAGEFSNVGGSVRSNLAAVHLTTGAVVPWSPNPTLFTLALARWNDRLYVGGAFTNIAGVFRTNIAEFDLVTGAITSWEPALNRAQVRCLAVSGNTLYAGGLINTVRGISRRRIAAFDLPGGTLNSWNPGITGTAVVEAILPYQDRVYVGGRFTGAGGLDRTNIFACDATTAAVLPFTAHADQPVNALAATPDLVFAGGNFQRIGGLRRTGLAAMDSATGAVTDWDPNPDFWVQKLLLVNDVLYPAGVFFRIGGQTGRGIAAFSLSSREPPVFDTNSLTRLDDGRFRLRVTVSGATQVTIWVSADFSDWENLGTVPVISGGAEFTDDQAPGRAQRFYRASVP